MMKKDGEVRHVKNAKRWLGYALVALIAVLVLAQWVRGQYNAEPQYDPPQQEANIPDADTTQGVTGNETSDPAEPVDGPPMDIIMMEDGTYSDRDGVALYIHTFGHLPDNFITKREAEKLGWTGGSLEPYAPGKCIGGDRFGNYEGNLPAKDGRTYRECDIDTLGASSRGAKRIVFSNDGLIYYTEDHYETFTLLYGEGDNG